MGNSRQNTQSRVRRSENNHQVAEEESYPGEDELRENGSNEDLIVESYH